MQLTQHQCHVLKSSGPSDEMGSSILDGLQPLEQLTTDAGEQASAADEGIH